MNEAEDVLTLSLVLSLSSSSLPSHTDSILCRPQQVKEMTPPATAMPFKLDSRPWDLLCPLSIKPMPISPMTFLILKTIAVAGTVPKPKLMELNSPMSMSRQILHHLPTIILKRVLRFNAVMMGLVVVVGGIHLLIVNLIQAQEATLHLHHPFQATITTVVVEKDGDGLANQPSCGVWLFYFQE